MGVRLLCRMIYRQDEQVGELPRMLPYFRRADTWIRPYLTPQFKVLCVLGLLFCGLVAAPRVVQAEAVLEVCPQNPIQPRPAVFEPGGLILTTFDRASLWVVDVNRKARYPLPGSRPCGTNCHLSNDARWLAYLEAVNPAEAEGIRPKRPRVMKMRLNGQESSVISEEANEVMWWTDDTLLVWSPTHKAYLQPEGSEGTTDRIALDAPDAVSIQPGGKWALVVRYTDADEHVYFERALVNLDIRALNPQAALVTPLGADLPYFNSAAWSPDGAWLAYVAAKTVDGVQTAELFTIHPGDTQPAQHSTFAEDMKDGGNPVRIGGQTPVGGLSWSPDSRQVAFWVTPLDPSDSSVTNGESVLHVLDVNSGEIRRYCGFSTPDHTPNPPRLVWSPDSTNVAFGGNLPEDTRGVLLLALNIESGIFVELSDGIYPALGSADVIAWGLAPDEH